MQSNNRRPRPAPVARIEQIRGTFRPHQRGFGFIDLDEPIGEETSAFVRPPDTRFLLAGDVLTLDVDVDKDGRLTAVSPELTERRRSMLSGEIVAWGDGLAVRPDGALATSDWRLPRNVGGFEVGDIAVVALERGRDGRWRASRVVAGPFEAGTPDAVRATVVVRALDAEPASTPASFRHAQTDAAAAVRADAEAAARGDDPRSPSVTRPHNARVARVDRRDAVAFTIDSASSRDLDDAIIARAVDGGVAVEIHIADVASELVQGSALDAVAGARATSVYLAGRNIPMLPRSLSDDALSLLPGRERNTVAVSFFVPADGASRGVPQDVTVFRSKISTAARLTYLEVEAYLNGTGGVGDAVTSALAAAADAAEYLGAARDTRDTLDGLFEEAALRVSVDHTGAVVVHAPEHAPAAQELVERLMVAANESVASWLAASGMPALYRTHAGLRVDDEAMASIAGCAVAPEGVTPTPAQVRDVASSLNVDDAAAFAAVTASAMLRAAYTTDPGAHFGLGSAPYCHFTSPIRRFADIVNHRVIAAILDGHEAPYTVEELDAFAEHLDRRSGAASRAESLERAMLWSIALDAEVAGGTPVQEQAHLTRFTRRGAAVRINRFGVTGFVPAEAFGDGWVAAEDGLSAVIDGELYQVGRTLPVELTEVDGPAGRLVFAPAA